jgi:hypothetical protein
MAYSHEVSDTRIKRLMAQIGMPESTSLMLAMKQLEQEVRLEVGAEITPKASDELVAENTKLIEALHNERQSHGDTCVTLGMICQALGFDISDSEKALPAIKALVEAKETAEKTLVLIGEKAVVDWDDKTVGQVDAVVKDREKYKDWVCKVLGARRVPIPTVTDPDNSGNLRVEYPKNQALDDLSDALGKLGETTIERDRLREELASEKRVGNITMEAARQAAAERDQARRWVADLQSGMFVNCVYCGHRYGPKNDTPVAMADILKAHIAVCPQHPLSIARKALSCLVQAKLLKERDGKTLEYEAAKEAAWKLAVQALEITR